MGFKQATLQIWLQYLSSLSHSPYTPFKRQPHKIVKNTQTIGLSVSDHFVGLALKGLSVTYRIIIYQISVQDVKSEWFRSLFGNSYQCFTLIIFEVSMPDGYGLHFTFKMKKLVNIICYFPNDIFLTFWCIKKKQLSVKNEYFCDFHIMLIPVSSWFNWYNIFAIQQVVSKKLNIQDQQISDFTWRRRVKKRE